MEIGRNIDALMAGIDIPIPELQTAIHQPKYYEIAYLGEEEYFFGVQLFCFNKNTIIAKNQEEREAIKGLSTMNDFQIFMALINESDQAAQATKKRIVLSVLMLLFPSYNAQFSPLNNGIFMNDPTAQKNFMINETNFEVLKEAISSVSGLNNTIGGQNSGFNPVGKKAARIAAKLMEARARTATSKGGKNSGLLSRYVSILTIGLNSMSLQDCLNLTVFQIYDLMERFGLYTSWDLDIKSRLAGGSPDSKPDDWMQCIH